MFLLSLFRVLYSFLNQGRKSVTLHALSLSLSRSLSLHVALRLLVLRSCPTYDHNRTFAWPVRWRKALRLSEAVCTHLLLLALLLLDHPQEAELCEVSCAAAVAGYPYFPFLQMSLLSNLVAYSDKFPCSHDTNSVSTQAR